MKYLAYPEFTALANTLSGRDVGAVTLAARVEAYSFKPVGDDRKLAKEVQEKFGGDVPASGAAAVSSSTSPNTGALPAPIALGTHTSSSVSGSGGAPADSNGMAPELLPPPSFRPILRGESWESMGGVSSGRDEGDDMEYRPDPLRNLSVTRVRSDSVTLASDANGSMSAGGVNMRTYACLVATLNSSYPDYDFSSLPRDAFRRVPDIAEAVSNVNNQLTELAQLEAREPKLAQELNFAAYSVQTLAAPHTPVTPPTPQQPAAAGLSRADSAGHTSAGGSTARHAGSRSRGGSVSAAADASTSAPGSSAPGSSGTGGSGGVEAAASSLPPAWRPALHRKGSAASNSVMSADEAHAPAATAAHAGTSAHAGGAARERAGSVSARHSGAAQSSSNSSSSGGGGGGSGGGGGGNNASAAAAALSLHAASVAGQVPDTPAGYILQRLSHVPGGYGMSFMEALWLILNDVITLSACEVYTYTPIWDTDPLIVGALWSFNYFFVNRQRKKLVFFSCTARSTISRLAVVAPVRPIAPSPSPDITNIASSQDAPSASPANTESGAEQEVVMLASAEDASSQVAGRKRRATREAADAADASGPAPTRRFSGEHAPTPDVT